MKPFDLPSGSGGCYLFVCYIATRPNMAHDNYLRDANWLTQPTMVLEYMELIYNRVAASSYCL